MPINGVRCARIIGEFVVGGVRMTQAQYFVFGRTQRAVLTFVVPSSRLEHYRLLFDNTAASTNGFSGPMSAWDGYVRDGLAGIAAAFVFMWLRRRNRSRLV
jgi:hypothetical protein